MPFLGINGALRISQARMRINLPPCCLLWSVYLKRFHFFSLALNSNAVRYGTRLHVRATGACFSSFWGKERKYITLGHFYKMTTYVLPVHWDRKNLWLSCCGLHQLSCHYTLKLGAFGIHLQAYCTCIIALPLCCRF